MSSGLSGTLHTLWCYNLIMNNFQPKFVQQSKSISLIGWVLGILFILKAVDFFLSIRLTSTSELDPTVLSAILYLVSGIAMLLLAIGTIKQARWVRSSLYVVFVSNAAYLIYSSFIVIDWVNAIISFLGAILLFVYLRQTKNNAGKRLLGLQIFTIFTLLPATVFILLTVIFTDQSLQDDSSLRLQTVETLAAEDNLYATLTSAGTKLPSAAKEAIELTKEYPTQWNQSTANLLLQKLQPYVSAYVMANEQDYQCPSSVNDFAMDAEMCSLNLVRDYASIMKFAAITEAKRGNITLAKEYAQAAITNGLTLVQSDNVTTIEYLVGLASINIGLDTLEILEKEDILSQPSISALLEDVSIPITTLRTPLQREYLGLRIAIDESLDLPQTYLYHPNRTRNELFTFMNKAINNSATTCDISANTASQTDVELLEYVDSVQRNAYNPTRPNLIGNIYLSVVLASMSGIGKNVCDTNERIQNIQID